MPRTLVELRIDGEEADRYLAPDLGQRLVDNLVRKVLVEVGSPLFDRIGRLERELSAQGRLFTAGWAIKRTYTQSELAAAEAFRLFITPLFEPAGEEFGPVYDYGRACSICRVGRRQMQDLTLDLTRIQRKDFAISIGREMVVPSVCVR